MRGFELLISEYKNIEIPEELESVVKKTTNNFERRRKRERRIIKFAVSVVTVK
ncbi:MAG: hypothetical protein PHD36_06660 [Desulfotomaculaceae bacterium]|nr:hypothetical protein [Desulfotomaculaceae bacterium]